MADMKKRLWKFVFYRDSCPENYGEIIEDWGVPVFVSPWHNLDINHETNVLKKEHKHGMMEFDGPVTYSYALGLAEQLGCSIVKGSNSKRRDERYMCHLDSPTKAQYDIADCECFGGYSPRYLDAEDNYDGLQAITEICEREGIVYYADLCNEIITKYPEYVGCLLRFPAHWNNYCYSRLQLSRAGDNYSYVKSRRRVGRYASDV